MGNMAVRQRLNWRQACEILGCSKCTFYRLIRSGILPAFRLARSSRGLWVYEDDCKNLLTRVVPATTKQSTS